MKKLFLLLAFCSFNIYASDIDYAEGWYGGCVGNLRIVNGGWTNLSQDKYNKINTYCETEVLQMDFVKPDMVQEIIKRIRYKNKVNSEFRKWAIEDKEFAK